MLYKVVLKPESPYMGEIRANSLFGAFCTVYSSMVSDKPLLRAINDITFSDLFIEDCMPVGVENGETKFNIPKDVIINEDEIHNTISRDKSKNIENGTHILEVKYSNKNMVFYVDVDCISYEVLTLVIELMLKKGLGKKISSGKGQFSLVSITEEKFNYTDCKEVIALSDFIPSDKTSTEYIQLGVKSRNGITTDGRLQMDIKLISAGSKFKYKNGMELITGRVIKDKYTDTYVNGRTILMPA